MKSTLCDKKKFLPATVNKIEHINKNSKNINVKKIENILNAYNLYYNLYKQNLDEEEIVNICEYINEYYRYYEIHEKSLIVGIYRLILKKDMNNLIKLQCMLHETHSNSDFLYLGYLFLNYNEILQLSNDPSKNMQVFYNIEEFLSLMEKNPSQTKNMKKFIKIHYIHQYFICEYYLNLSIEYMNNNQLIDALLYLRKILIRSNVHAICSLEALLLMLKIFILLNIPVLIEKYFNLILKIYLKNSNHPFMKNYLLRTLYILKNNNYLNLV